MIKAVGTPCSNSGANCTLSRCCNAPGNQCFKKDNKWSSCKPWCAKGPDPMDPNPAPWDCTPLGPKRPGIAPPLNWNMQAPNWVREKCAATGADCSKQMCCKDAGKQCFEKTEQWSSCKEECVPGPDPVDLDSAHWSCKSKGSRTPGPYQVWAKAAAWVATNCSKTGENCLETRCCKDPGHQCFLKNEAWAACMPDCLHGPMLSDENADIWNCTALGGRTPGMAQASRPRPLAKWVAENCSKDGEDCTNSMCCVEPTMQCYRKNSEWAACQRGCTPGNHSGDAAGGPWDCALLGPRTPRKWGSPTLYCYSVIRLYSYEAAIIRAQASTDGGIGIFGCDQFDVFASDGRGFIGDGPEGPVWTQHFDDAPVTVSVDHTAGNTALFMNVWEAVRFVGRWALTEWTIKADPDAVLLPDRLRTHLRPWVGQPVYVKNCNSPTLIQQGPMMFGSVEAISHQGMERYYYGGGEWRCKKNYQYGEDRWLGECFNEIGVQGVGDWHMVGDKLCILPECGNAGCSNCGDGRAAYHHYKSPESWLGCYYTAKR